jgi:2,4-dienoyl-CoA reductase-like NADH-dependent reductase (Old Yellow Enzyme family)
MPTVRSDERGPFGRNREATRAVREAVRAAGCETPVVISGGISTFEQAEQLLQSGAADVVASARQSLADPDWFRKLRLGLGGEVRRCVFTNYCEGLDQVHKAVTCKLWDRMGRDSGAAEQRSGGGDSPVTADGRRLVAPPWEPGAR